MTFLSNAALSAMLISTISSLSAAECNRCIEIRKENKNKTFNDGYAYYEDYLNSHKADAVAMTSDAEIPSADSSKSSGDQTKATKPNSPTPATDTPATTKSIFEFNLEKDADVEEKTTPSTTQTPKIDRKIEPVSYKILRPSKTVSIVPPPGSQRNQNTPETTVANSEYDDDFDNNNNDNTDEGDINS